MDAVVMLAAGDSRRFGGSVSKVLRKISGTPVIVRALAPFLVAVERMALVIAARPQEVEAIERLLPRARVVAGGPTRTESLRRGVAALPAGVDVVLVHEAARPLTSVDVVRRVLDSARRHGAAAPLVGVKDALHHVARVEGEGRSRIVDAVERVNLGAAQSPQAARRDLLQQALDRAAADDYEADDEAALLLKAGIEVTAVRGRGLNLRITRPEDLRLAEALLGER